MPTTPIPNWMKPPSGESWPTVPIANEKLRYRTERPDHYANAPEVRAAGPEVEHVYPGGMPGECLTVAFIEKGDPASDIRQWVDASIALAGTPSLALLIDDATPPELREWKYLGSPEALCALHKLDEIHLYEGFAVLPGSPPSALRLYFVLARRYMHAWKIGLCISSACLPGTAEAQVDANDHVRAAATFGALAFE